MIHRHDTPTSLRERIRSYYAQRKAMLRNTLSGRPDPMNVHPLGIASSISSMVDAIRRLEGMERKGRNRWTVR